MFAVAESVGDRHQVPTDNQWELLELLLPKSDGRVGRKFSNNRQAVEGVLFRLRPGYPAGTCPRYSVRGRRYGNGTAGTPPTEPGIGCWLR